MRRSVITRLAVVTALALAACDPGGDAAPDAEPATTTTSEAPAPDDAERPQRDDEDAGDDDHRERERVVAEITDLDIQQRHPNGTVLRVLGVSLAETSIGVEVEVLNGFTKQINLNSRASTWWTTWPTPTTSSSRSRTRR